MSFQNYCKRRSDSFVYAARGVRVLFATQVHAKIHFFAALLVVFGAWWLEVSALEWCVLALSVALVWVSEAMNTALEFTVDLLSPGHHPIAGKAKDVAAGAVLLASSLATLIGAIIFVPKLLAAL
jgi:diacylglycerol kinase (ATP)